MQRSKEVGIRGGAVAIVLCFALLVFAAILQPTITNFSVNDNTSALKADNFYNINHSIGGDGREFVRIGGMPIGICAKTEGLIVLGKCEVLSDGGKEYPLKDADIRKGDILLSVNGEKVTFIYQLKKLLEKEDEVRLELMREGKRFEISATTCPDSVSGGKRLGLLLREDVGGIGTLTFVTSDGIFASLGHFISDPESGLSYELNCGNIYSTQVDGILKGERGKAGGLLAEINRLNAPIGKIQLNSKIGLYGRYTAPLERSLYRIAEEGEAQVGAAQVYTTIEGSTPQFYDIDIVKVISQTEPGEKGMVISVRDKTLLEKTGGIVQGMSGSPIVQNGMIIGAVTHVFVQDPTRGYAAHSRFMYETARSLAESDDILPQITFA